MKNQTTFMYSKHICLISAIAFVFALILGGISLSNNPSNALAKTKDSEETKVTWTMDADCSSCHNIQPASLEDEDCLASRHAVLSCTKCHADEAGLTKAHKKAKAEKADKVKRLRKSVINQELCITCHGTLEDLAQKTEDIELTDRQGTVVNPHAVPDNEDHQQAVTCSDCHVMHSAPESAEEDSAKSDKDVDIDELRREATIEKANELCISCHHDNVFECHTCHD